MAQVVAASAGRDAATAPPAGQAEGQGQGPCWVCKGPHIRRECPIAQAKKASGGGSSGAGKRNAGTRDSATVDAVRAVRSRAAATIPAEVGGILVQLQVDSGNDSGGLVMSRPRFAALAARDAVFVDVDERRDFLGAHPGPAVAHTGYATVLKIGTKEKGPIEEEAAVWVYEGGVESDPILLHNAWLEEHGYSVTAPFCAPSGPASA